MTELTAMNTEPMKTSGLPTKLRAFVELTKLRITVMVLFTFCVAGVLAAGPDVSIGTLAWAPLGLLFMAASGNAMNMYLERYTDFLMVRTAKRPLPDQRLSSGEVVMFASVCFGISAGIFLATVNWQTALCGLLTWLLYVCVYTPLKTRTTLNTEIGAIPGALPIVMGSLAVTGTVNLQGWAFFATLLLWQFPHFMAIAWLYRDQYRQGGHKMLTVTDPTGRQAGIKAVVTCAILIGVSLLPALTFRTELQSLLFSGAALCLGCLYMRDSIRFARDRNVNSARRLLKTSILYLPLFMLALVIASLS